nr:hypothetical protein [uncultured Olsenella sp.]
MAADECRRDGVSSELDVLSSTLMGDAFDMLASGDEVNVLLVVQDEDGNAGSYEFSDDGIEQCIEAARSKILELRHAMGDEEAGLGLPVRYALAYEGAVGDDDGSYQDALMLEFGERGYKSYSAFSYFEGRGEGDGFRWTEPAPAGELEPLI